jgi:hypothetical protein
LRRSHTSAEAKTSTNAQATPPAKRNVRKATVDKAKAMVPVVRELTIKDRRS